jgi:hypothetical protein
MLFVLAYKLFGKAGIIAWIALAAILANIQVTKSITVFGMHATLGNILYGTISLATDSLNELYGKKTARQGVMVGFFVMIATLISMQLALLYLPNEVDISHPALQTIFGFLPRILLGSIVAYLISQFLDIVLYQKIWDRLPKDKHLWIRNNLSTIISQLVDTLIFVPIAFLGIYSSNVLWQIIFSTYLIKLFIALLDTPFMYLIKRIKPVSLLEIK